MTAAPLIVTLALDEKSFQFFNRLRQRHFPTERNFLAAHLTLFHHLPPDEPKLKDDLISWSREQYRLTLSVTEVKSIGKGVAYKVVCPGLLQLHSRMQKEWMAWLQPQDKQKLWPHVTVQNKVMPAEAKETLAVLQSTFTPFTAAGTGFQLWRYDNGPWTFLEAFPFGKA